uniref:SCP domain-containing protein n=1 Tax=Megaselia scalaris TaxID=36166 RepID=T1H5I9_MEGSC
PQFYGDSISDRVLLPSLKRVQQRIVTLHDYFRNKVSPPAPICLKWHKGAAKTAQKWAQQCTFLTHDSHNGRYVHNFGSCGQNIFVSTHKVPWQFVLNSWYIERQNFTYGSRRNSLKAVGHYTQMVWASTHKVGCGIAKCMRGPDGRPFYNYVCNYCPIGNYKDRFYKPYEVGNQCGACRGSCKSNRLK